MTILTRNDASSVVQVALAGREYDIVIGRGWLQQLGHRVSAMRPGARVAIVTDENVARHHLRTAMEILEAADIRATSIVVPPGEASKSHARFEQVCDRLIEAKLERDDLVVALGGGVIGDLAGFAASVVRRGLDFIQVPTTLLAQVDSSVGGKTAINSRHGKNLVGAFHQPILVLADTALLDTLPDRDFRAGYAELVKHSLINDAAHFAWLEANWRSLFAGDGDVREQAIAASCRTKAEIVSRDERETGDRALLNLGHTFGHALEAAAGFSDRLLHGEAIAIGMVLAFQYSVRLGAAHALDAERVHKHFNDVGLPTDMQRAPGGPFSPEVLMQLMSQDKKVKRGQLTLILAHGIGRVFIEPQVVSEDVRQFLFDLIEKTR